MGNLGLGQTTGRVGQTKVGLVGRGTTGLIPMMEPEDEELDCGEDGHEGAEDTDLVAREGLITLILSCDRSESSDNVTSDSSSSTRDSRISVSASDTSILSSSSESGLNTSTPPQKTAPSNVFPNDPAQKQVESNHHWQRAQTPQKN